MSRNPGASDPAWPSENVSATAGVERLVVTGCVSSHLSTPSLHSQSGRQVIRFRDQRCGSSPAEKRPNVKNQARARTTQSLQHV